MFLVHAAYVCQTESKANNCGVARVTSMANPTKMNGMMAIGSVASNVQALMAKDMLRGSQASKNCSVSLVYTHLLTLALYIILL